MTWLRSATGDLRYLAWGRYADLLPSLDYLSGARGRIERLFLRTPFHRTASERDVPDEARVAVDRLSASLGTGSAALLLYTGYYKDTWFVGPTVSEHGHRAFAKLFKSLDQAVAEVDRAEQAARLGDGAFLTMRATRTGTVVTYDIVTRTGRASDAQAVTVGAAIARGQEPVGVPTSLREEWAIRSEAADEVLATEFGRSGAVVVPVLAEGVTWGLTHGDVTPWNIIPTGDDLVLIDYERVAMRPVFFDVVYAGSQAPALRGSPTWSRPSVDRELRAAGIGSGESRNILGAALGAAVVEATEDLVRHPENADRTHRLVTSKLRYLEEL